MPAKPRSETFDPDVVGVYHCWNRLVRRRHLFGWDAFTGNDYSYRKGWVRDRFRELAAVMAIDILDCRWRFLARTTLAVWRGLVF
jgi:hypothetical protein